MNNEKWSDVKVRIKKKFNKLSDSDIDGVKGSMGKLTSKLSKLTTIARIKHKRSVSPLRRLYLANSMKRLWFIQRE